MIGGIASTFASAMSNGVRIATTAGSSTTYGPPRLQAVITRVSDHVCTNISGVKDKLWPRWRSLA